MIRNCLHVPVSPPRKRKKKVVRITLRSYDSINPPGNGLRMWSFFFLISADVYQKCVAVGRE